MDLRYIILVLAVANIGYMAWHSMTEMPSAQSSSSAAEPPLRPLINTGLVKVSESNQL
jgi:hypothetical protein